MKKQVTILTLLFLFSINFVSAQYISGDIYIYETGEVRFNVDTDISLDIQGLEFSSTDKELTGSTEMLTKKEKGIWTLSLDFENYETILLDINFPRNLKSINSVNGIENILDINSRTISLIDKNKKLAFEVTYTIENSEEYYWIFYLFIILVLVVIIYFLMKKRKKKSDRLNYVLPLINDQEKKIIEILMKKPARQKEIRKKLKIPKASFSRYMINLEKKKLIIRDGEGKNRLVKLK